MAQRAYTEVSRIIRPRTERVIYLGSESEDEIDFVYEESEELSEYSCFDESDDENQAEIERDENYESEENEAESDRGKENTKGSRKKKFVYGKNKHTWSTELPRGQRSRPKVHLPGRKGNTPCETPYEFWHLLFTDAMLDLVVQYTNAEIENYRASNERTNSPAQSTNVTKIEIEAYIGLLYLGGYQRQSSVAVEELWSNEFGSNLYRSTMTEMRFKFISSRLRFDDKNTRDVRRETDAFAPIRELWDTFIGNCQANYTASDFLTIDEQLLDFRGKFSERVYKKSKPVKNGIKIVTLNDAETFYLYSAIPFVGGVSTERGESVPDYYVRNLCKPIYGTNRHITTGNWFTSVEIFNKMKDEFNLTMLGTVRKNKRHIPVTFTRTAAAGTTRYGYDGKNVLLSYCPKKNKVVLCLSSYHKSVSERSEGKPEMVQMYNETKSGTKVFDFLCGSFTCARKTRRWSMRFFMAILDQAGVNACILYNFQCDNPVKDRRQFLRELILELVTPHMRTRLNTPNLPRNIVSNIRSILNEPEDNINFDDKLEKRKRCTFCDPKKDRKTNKCCVKCNFAVCEEHRYTCCRDCL